MTISDKQLIAYVDGELSSEAMREVDVAAQADAAVAVRLAAHKRLRSGIAEAYSPVLDEAVPEALLAAVRGSSEAKVVSFAARRRTLPAWTAGVGMAACLVLGLAIGFGAPDAALVAADMTAKGALAAALDRQLASDQEGAAIRIGVTFTDTSGAYCRTFQASAAHVAGLACREGKAWRVPVLSTPSSGEEGTFRTAGSMPAAVAAVVEQRRVGEALDAAGEARARAADWAAH
jgi:hypothetical protein